MPKKMLIDATHAEETRVAVVDGHRLVEFDYESKVRKQLKGSIFLAKVTRVEPSLQAAFVNFGGNRHGFLPFSEIHPDYYRIPIADREKLLAEQKAEIEAEEQELAEQEAQAEAEAAQGEGEEDGAEGESDEDVIEEVGGGDGVLTSGADGEDSPAAEAEDPDSRGDEDTGNRRAPAEEEDFEQDEDDGRGNVREPEPSDDEMDETQPGNFSEGAEGREENGGPRDRGRGRGRWNRGRGRGGRRMAHRSRSVEIVGGDSVEGDGPRRPNLRRQYKIQEVIKRGQIMLIQVSKEERGNKGAAVTTYLSLPGRYCVLMPNSPRGGGVSRKIESFDDRRRMKEILNELNVPEGMSVIMRTAGVTRTKPEIKRDLDYMLRLWDNIRELTLKSSAPALIYEEGDLIKRAIRDLYAKDTDEIHVSGAEGYKAARDFMKMLIPSHIKRVVEYTDEKIPLFHRYQVEQQISDIGEPSVTLRSGGYLVINPTEALVSIDVNSGRATKERHIEETALKTNLEAADEVARQLRLRDLGGLVVIDFIDMEDRRNNAKVERRLKDALSQDRARIQVGRISSFGLLELSRQRLNPSLTETQSEKCPHCKGAGYIKTVDSVAITALRAVEQEGIKGRAAEITLSLPTSVALYILNNKRQMLVDLERRYGFRISIRTDEALAPGGCQVDVAAARTARGESDDGEDAEGDGVEQPAAEREERSESREERRDDQRRDRRPDGPRPEGERRDGEGRFGEGRGDGRGEGRSGRRRGRRGGRRRGGERFRDDGPRPENRAISQGAHSFGEEAAEDDTEREALAVAGTETFVETEVESAPDETAAPTQGRRRPRGRGGRPPADHADTPEPDVSETQAPAPAEASEEEPKTPARRKPGRPRARRAEADIPETPAPERAEPSVQERETAPPAEREASRQPSNDARKPQASVQYETVTEASPETKKRGWWNRIME